jgi:hypothetical protein
MDLVKDILAPIATARSIDLTLADPFKNAVVDADVDRIRHLMQLAYLTGRATGLAGSTIVAPPLPDDRETRPEMEFCNLFVPLDSPHGCHVWEREDIPHSCDPREWWTIVEEDGLAYVRAGFRFVNRIGYARCLNLWNGNPNDYPTYQWGGAHDD